MNISIDRSLLRPVSSRALFAFLLLAQCLTSLFAQAPSFPALEAISLSQVSSSPLSLDTPKEKLYAEVQAKIENLNQEIQSLDKRKQAYLDQKTSIETELNKSLKSSPKTTATTETELVGKNPRIEVLEKILETMDQTIDTSEQIKIEFDQILTEIDKQEGSKKALGETKSKLEKITKDGPEEKHPYSFLLLDSTEEDLRTEYLSEGRLEASRSVLRNARDQAEANLKEAAAQRRLALENFENETNSLRKPLLKERLSFTQAQSMRDDIQLFFLRLQLQGEDLLQEIHKNKVLFYTTKIGWLEKSATFRKEDLEKQKQALEKRLEEIRKKNSLDKTKLAKAMSSWNWLKRLINKKPNPGNIEKTKAYETDVDVLRQKIVIRKSWEKWILERIRVWENRFRLHTEKELRVQNRTKWRSETEEEIRILERQKSLQSGRRADVRKALLPIQRRLDTETEI